MEPFFAQENQSGSTGTVLLVDLLPAGLHGDSNAHPTPARCHAGHLTPGVRVWVITLHTIQECVTVVASCKESRGDGHYLQGQGKERRGRNHKKPSFCDLSLPLKDEAN